MADTTNPPADPNAAVKAETDRLKAEAELEKAKAERVKALGLPAFDGKTTLGVGAGAIETLILATDAVGDAAAQIAGDARQVKHPNDHWYGGNFLVLAGDEQLDFGLATAIRAEIRSFDTLFDTLLP